MSILRITISIRAPICYNTISCGYWAWDNFDYSAHLLRLGIYLAGRS